MGELTWQGRLLVGYLSGLGLALYGVAWHSEWSTFRSIVVVALLVVVTSTALALTGVVARAVTFLACAFILTVVFLAVIHYRGDPAWLKDLPASPGGDGVLWQVQTTFLSVGFAGLAITAQLFAETPLAIGASRVRVLAHVWAGWFAGVGVVANAVIAVETIWLPSDLGVVIAALSFVPTVAFLLLSTVRLMKLFGNPSLLDAVVRLSLVETLASRLETASRTYAAARSQLDGLFDSEASVGTLGPSAVTLRVPVPRAGLVIRAIRPNIVRQAKADLAPKATEDAKGEVGKDDLFTPARILLTVEPGDRTRHGETAFRVSTARELDETARANQVRLLQLSIEFEGPGTVTPYEETDREIANIKDAIGTSLRAGAFGTAERALELLGQVVRGVWMARPESLGSSRRSSFTRQDWLFRSIGEVEQDALLSPRAAGLFVGQAMTRALEAPRTGSTEYVDECLRSFPRLWFDILRHGDSEFEALPSRITTCVQNLASFAFSTMDEREDLEARATWAMVELIKLALDARKPTEARLAARELDDLFAYSGRGGSGRAHVRGGQLVLSGWLRYLVDKKDDRDPDDAGLRALLAPRGTWEEILFARTLAERGAAPFSRWDWWEIEPSASGRAQTLELSGYIDKAELAGLASSYGQLPPAHNEESASTYKRFIALLDEGDRDLSPQESNLKDKLSEEVRRWEAAEDDRLAQEPLSPDKIAELQAALRETLDAGQRLATEILTIDEVPAIADQSRPILGMNFRVPKYYLVDKFFNNTYADPKELGQIIARGFMEGEDRRIVDLLRSLQNQPLNPTPQAILQQIDALGNEASHYILVTPFGGLMDLEDWYSTDFLNALSRVRHIEISALENEAILFDRRNALLAHRVPEEKDGLTPVAATSIAMGVFEDVQGEAEPQVRIETGEVFVVWGAEVPRIRRFGSPEAQDADNVEGATE